LALEADVSRRWHQDSVLSRRLHLSALVIESLRRELDALCSVAPLLREGDGEASPLGEEVADVVAVHAPVAVPAALTGTSFIAPVEESLVTTVGSPFGAQEPVPDVAEPELPVVQVQRLPSVDEALTGRHPCSVRWVDDEAGVASRKAWVVDVSFPLSPPAVPAHHNGSPVALAAGRGGSNRHARNPRIITVISGQLRKELWLKTSIELIVDRVVRSVT